eukprot:2711142-Rhodomonas_salina.2
MLPCPRPQLRAAGASTTDPPPENTRDVSFRDRMKHAAELTLRFVASSSSQSVMAPSSLCERSSCACRKIARRSSSSAMRTRSDSLSSNASSTD